MIKFVLGDIFLEYDPGSGRFRHPATGEWVDEPHQCLAGLSEPDPDRRRRFGQLAAMAKEALEHLTPEDLVGAEAVDFSSPDRAD